MIRRPPRSTQSRSSAASDVYKRQIGNSPAGLSSSARAGRRSRPRPPRTGSVSYTHLRAHETRHELVCRLLLEKKKKTKDTTRTKSTSHKKKESIKKQSKKT